MHTNLQPAYFPAVGFKKRQEKLVRASDHAESQLYWHRVGNEKRLCYRMSAVVRTSTLTQQMVQIDCGAEYGNCELSNTSFRQGVVFGSAQQAQTPVIIRA